jgi:hypothetical protein
MGRHCVHLIRENEFSADLCERLRKTGATGICLPVERTRTALQSLADIANRAALGIYAWIDLRACDDPDRIRRLVDAYPFLDGYFVRGFPPEAADLLPGPNLIPVFDFEERVPALPAFAMLLPRDAAVRPGSALESTIAAHTARDSLLNLTAIIEDSGPGALAHMHIAARAESAGARGVLFSTIPFDELNREPKSEC